MNTHKNNLTK